jgi:hypothetical protein
VFAIAESPRQKDLIWAGSDDGLVHVTRDGGKSWATVTAAMPGFPEWGTVSLIEPSPFDAGTAYVVVDAHRLDDMRPYLYRTADTGRTWKRLDAGLPADVYLHAVREDPHRRGQLYLGTERGVMYSTDDGTTWAPLQLNLPTVAVHDLVVKDDALVVGTHGRSIWILDDLTPVREMSAMAKDAAVHLFPVADTTRWEYGDGNWGRGPYGENPPQGAAIYYYLKEKPKGALTIDVLDAQGTRVRRLSSTPRDASGSGDHVERETEDLKKQALPVEPGVQRAVWNLRHEGAKRIQGAKIDWGSPEVGPLVVPGAYTVRITADGRSLTTPVRVLPDPRAKVSQADLEAQVQFVLKVRDAMTRLTEMVESLRSIRRQLADRQALLKDDVRAKELVAASEALIKRLDDLENQAHNPTAEVVYDILAMKGGTRLYSRLSPLVDFARDGSGPPTQGVREVFAGQEKELNGYLGQFDSLISADLAKVNGLASKLGIGFVVVPR